MPELTNKPLDQATKDLTDLGFVGKITQTPQVNDAVGENIVFAQDPATGTDVPTDGNLTLTFNPPKAPFTLGNFVGAQIADVKAALDQAKVPYQVTEVESDRPVGEVLSQDPAPGPVPGNTVVKMTVSSGLPKVSIPNVANTPSVAAANQLGGLGLVTTEQSEANDTVAAGTVIRTDPPAGTQVDKGSTVVLVVSSGATPVQVPNVVGATESAARDALQNANLKSQVVNVDVPFGSPQANVVIDQTPGAGDQVAPGSTVTIRIGKPGNPTTTATPTTASGTTSTSGP
jgi:serine/threonine-protein kinase